MCCCQGSGCTRVYLRSFQIFVEFFVWRWNQWCRTLLLHHSHFSEIQMKNGRNTKEKWKKYGWVVCRNILGDSFLCYSETNDAGYSSCIATTSIPLPFFYLLFLFLLHRLMRTIFSSFNTPRVTHRRRCTPGIKDSQLEKVGAAPSRLHWSSSRLQSGFRPCNIATITSFVLLTAYSLTQKYWNMCLEPIFGYLAEQADAPSLISLIS